ncbi:MAG TPA: 16S rRNA (adenine(1518)-N(6)/adenine(1519)-N(6))-dimethyltransferase RsmA [Bacteroidales bacterium]|nr:16S rRNA (adenine(1518)-N(6)/adenine(1519)-N(6))-dimethyltransferase RsmA [Bacteroidales bacterium]HPD24832.1 16S rRNA (adenine(1518)-N(6)/adenine(1519)-N(6))-dimethyltransferase RsmA [Bacteroidales bacterium]HRS99566.1 16S rRNA (adenine(1518)-N(6)/adenine(1519)-N(6))-dimethyltransferase RsmA [Bacteroidales bacterium]HRT80420.1 16S rRNA (adenine(1518)-N(6)/adenine(1519)-N(6))-dimethyltransferase RsmA [Bacteroidales bacterium]
MVKPKKYLGQHFLKDKNIAEKIAKSLKNLNNLPVMEIGPGTGVLTKFLVGKSYPLILIEIDEESVDFLKTSFPDGSFELYNADFLKLDIIRVVNNNKFCVIGNFPYNISSQIFFKILKNRTLIEETVCMLQKEVAERICSIEGSKEYGILSVLIQLYYKTEFLFSVSEKVFFPPPKVKSAVIRLTKYRDEIEEVKFENLLLIVKTAFNQRRKTLRNALKLLLCEKKHIDDNHHFFDKRAEQLSPEEFILLTKMIFN